MRKHRSRLIEPSDHATSSNWINGVRYAATRADVVAHSQGGQLTRFYISKDTVPLGGIDRVGWIVNILDNRSEDSAVGRWPYLRSANWGAGSIRRLITLGSPFKGSPLANDASVIFAPGDASQPPSAAFQALSYWYANGIPYPMPAGLSNLLFPGGNYEEPTCLSDLSTDSEAQTALELAIYPMSHRTVRWFPVVGIATQSAGDAPVQATVWELLFTLVPLIPPYNAYDPDGIDPLNPTSSDLIVPEQSQRNGVSVPVEYLWHAHVPIGVDGVLSETASPVIADHVGRILSSPLEEITLPAEGIYVPDTVNNVHLYKLGWE